jgi:predicted ATPase
MAIGQVDKAITLIDDTISQVEENGDFFFMPEALRLRGCALLVMPKFRVDDAETWFMRSLKLSRRQGAQAWELRTAIDLATLLVNQGRPDNACRLLQPMFERFVEGLETADLKAANCLLADLRG